jgi:pimeloyl-ACP methyl ester carboxylesterase
MKKTIFSTSITVLIIFTLLSFFSCSKEDDLSNLDDTIFVRHKDADMPAYIHGNGSEKVFLITLHGGPGGAGLGMRNDAFKNIENSYAVVYFDQRGSGMAQGSFSENDTTIDIMAEDVLALVNVLKHKYGGDSRFFLLGHSWGATLGTATVLKDQNEFLGWIAVDGTHNPRDVYAEYLANFDHVATQQITLGNSISFWESVHELIVEVDATFNRDDIGRLNSKGFDAENTLVDDAVINRVEGLSDVFFQYNLLTFFWNINNIQSILDPDIQGILSYTDMLPEITIPSLILWGKHDMVVPPFFAQEAFDNLGSNTKEMVIFERSGHAPMNSEGGLFTAEVIRFIDQNK